MTSPPTPSPPTTGPAMPSPGGRREAAAGYALVAPALLGITAFLLVPIGVLAWLSFQHWDLLGPITGVGLANWQSVLSDPAIWHSFGVTLLFVALAVPIQIALGIWLARLLSKELPGSSAIRTILVLPWVCAPLVLGIVWRWIFEPTGVVNSIIGERIEWTSTPELAFAIAVLVTVWTKVGYVTLFFLAGMASIPKQITEAARMDGASPLQSFWRVELPMLRPTLFFVMVTSIIEGFQTFDLIYSLTPNGGPQGATDLIAARIYAEAFTANDLGRAAAVALLLFAVLVAITLVQNRYFSGRTTYERS